MKTTFYGAYKTEEDARYATTGIIAGPYGIVIQEQEIGWCVFRIDEI